MKSQDGTLPAPYHMLFNPFDVSPCSNITFTEFLDPDSNFFNSSISESLSCDYFSIDQFNSLLLEVPKSQSKKLSVFSFKFVFSPKIMIYY